MGTNKIHVEVAYATPLRQEVLTIEVPLDSTIAAAIQQSGICLLFPEINLMTQPVGIFGKRCTLSDRVYEGDRIEIYRPLIIDPKEARRVKAKK